MSDPGNVLAQTIAAWVADPHSDVEYAEQVEGRWAVRMRQGVRSATTVWWTVGDRTVAAESYVLPAPPASQAEVYRLCLLRNHRMWRCHFSLDREGAVVLTGRLKVEEVTAQSLDLLLGEIYEAVELSFRPLVTMAFRRD
ncbi:MAG: YbjN domain-containing protein [bacterium]|nr:YbjN domain-containing protein [Acidimicrobiia bacterium]MCY4650890.1 YbjN domain-containing protein [bacterium]